MDDDKFHTIPYNVLKHHEVQETIDSLVTPAWTSIRSLINSECFRTEVYLLRNIILRISCNLRKASLTRVNQKLMRNVHAFARHEVFKGALDQLFSPLIHERIDKRTGDIIFPKNETIADLLKKVLEVANILKEISESCCFVGAQCISWLKLGHLYHHILPLISAVSRIRIFAKALLVYCCDVYRGLHLILIKFRAREAADFAASIDDLFVEKQTSPEVRQGNQVSSSRITRKRTGHSSQLHTLRMTPLLSSKSLLSTDQDVGVPVSRTAVTTTKTSGSCNKSRRSQDKLTEQTTTPSRSKQQRIPQDTSSSTSSIIRKPKEAKNKVKQTSPSVKRARTGSSSSPHPSVTKEKTDIKKQAHVAFKARLESKTRSCLGLKLHEKRKQMLKKNKNAGEGDTSSVRNNKKRLKEKKKMEIKTPVVSSSKQNSSGIRMKTMKKRKKKVPESKSVAKKETKKDRVLMQLRKKKQVQANVRKGNNVK